MIPLGLANPSVGMAGITTRAGRYVAGRQAACSLGSHPSGLDGRAWFRLLDAIPDGALFALSGGGRQFQAGPKGLSRP